MSISIVILAAGMGKRMRSSLPKVLHSLAGKPILEHIINTSQQLNPNNIYVVYGHGGEQVRSQLQHLPVQWIEQKERLGTAHATAQAINTIDDNQRLLILLGDTPLISKETLQKLCQIPENTVGLITAHMPNPDGLGRIIRNSDGNVIAIVEDKDATVEQRHIREINTGIMLISVRKLKQWLPRIQNNNSQNEYYLTDIIAMAEEEKTRVIAVSAPSCEEVQGINDREQLARLERAYQYRAAKQLMLSGVTLKDPARFDLRGELHCAEDVVIDINVIIAGKVIIGKNSHIGANTFLRDVTIGENVDIKANCVIEEAEINNDCVIGPYARVRPGTYLADEVHVGNFAEIKNSKVSTGSKIHHVSYTGDAVIGKNVNIGAGTITCNYDGANKHATIIGDNAFIGSGTELVAPVTVGAEATIGAGSTITHSAPANALTLRRAEQKTIANWQRPKKK